MRATRREEGGATGIGRSITDAHAVGYMRYGRSATADADVTWPPLMIIWQWRRRRRNEVLRLSLVHGSATARPKLKAYNPSTEAADAFQGPSIGASIGPCFL